VALNDFAADGKAYAGALKLTLRMEPLKNAEDPFCVLCRETDTVIFYHNLVTRSIAFFAGRKRRCCDIDNGWNAWFVKLEGIGYEVLEELRELAEVADHAAERGVILCMETHDDWCNPEHVAAVMARTDHPCVAVNWDIMHPVRTAEATVDQAYQVLQPWIRHVHIHDGGGENLTFAAIGEGPIDHLRTLELLAHAEYDGYLSGEWIGWEAYDIHLPRELATMQGYERRLSWDPERSDG